MVKYCPRCGEKTHNTAKYCGKCGYPFTGREKSGKYYSKLKNSKNIKLLTVTFVILFFIFGITFGITNFSRTSGSKGHIQKINVVQHTKQQVAHSLPPPNNAAQYNKPQVVHFSPPPKVISSSQNIVKENKNQPKLYEYYLIYYDNVKEHKTSTEVQMWINEKDRTIRVKIDKWFRHSDKTIHYTRKRMRFYFGDEYLDIYLQPRLGFNHLARAYYKHSAYYFKWSRTEITES
ncbi:hypothetical protein IPdc08_00114 [archaeon]|nr:hypothetical protein IPdc08_00114 [archaeon]